MMKQVNIRIPLRMLGLVLGLFLSVGAFAQITVKGHVKDSQGEPIIGATIRVVGQSVGGTISDFDGNFSLQAKQGAQLTVSSVGYQTATVAASPNVVVTLIDDAQVLENVVVIGYGRAKKSDLTGSVSAVKPDDMNHGLQTSANDMLQGKIAGVNVTNGGGRPGDGATIRIRGGSSLNASNSPLIVIDGLTMDSYDKESTNPLALVNPNDIETFTVLKDASATAIYGSRASNGVIIITTKKGRAGAAPSISYNGNVSVGFVSKKLDVMDASEYMPYIKNLVMNARGYSEEEYLASSEYANLGYFDEQGNHLFADTDWQKEIYRTAVSTDHNITVSGGLKNMPYRVSLGYTNQNGVVKKSDYQRYTASFNVSPTLLDNHLTFNINAKGMYSKQDRQSGAAIYNALAMDPTKPIYAVTSEMKKNYGGYWQWPSSASWADTEWTANKNSLAAQNPVAALELYNQDVKAKELIGNIEIVYKLHGLEDLQLHVNGGMDLSNSKKSTDVSPYSFDNYYYGFYDNSKTDTYNLSLNAYADYMKEIGIHNITAMVGYEWQHFHRKNNYHSYGLYPSTNTESPGAYYNESANPDYKTENYLVSFFGRLNYTLLDRYMLTATLRADGSSRFNWLDTADNEQWGLFPSVALAWRLKEENFLKNVLLLSLTMVYHSSSLSSSHRQTPRLARIHRPSSALPRTWPGHPGHR